MLNAGLNKANQQEDVPDDPILPGKLVCLDPLVRNHSG